MKFALRWLIVFASSVPGTWAACTPASPVPRVAVGSNCIYDVAMNAGYFSGTGSACARTGDAHPVTVARGRHESVVQSSGQPLAPSASAFSLRDWSNLTDTMFEGTSLSLRVDGAFSCLSGHAHPHSVHPIVDALSRAIGQFMEADIDGLGVRLEILATGDSHDTSAVRLSAQVTNNRSVSALIGARYAWVVAQGGYGYIAWAGMPSEEQPEPWNVAEEEFLAPPFDVLTLSDSRYPSRLAPAYLVGLSCRGPSRLEPAPTPPDRIAFGFDPSSFDPADRGGPFATCFDWHPRVPQPTTPDHMRGAPEVMAYWWGDTPGTAIQLEPGESTSFTVWEWAYLENPVQCDAGMPLVVECEGGAATARLDGSASFSTGGSPLWHEWSAPAGVVIADPGAAVTEVTFPGPGVHPVTLSAGVGPYERSCETVVHVQDTLPPVLVAPPPVRLLVSSLSDCSAPLRLEATASDGCDSSPSITHRTVPDIGSGGAIAEHEFGPGVTRVVFTATDASGNVAVSETMVEIVDDVPPSFASLSAAPSLLWPPRHQLVPVAVDAEATDACDASPDIVLMGVTSSEPEDDRGDGRTVPDVVDAEPGSDDRRMLLRAERSGRGAGRTYTLHYRVLDDAGNATDGSVTVRAPHDRRR